MCGKVGARRDTRRYVKKKEEGKQRFYGIYNVSGYNVGDAIVHDVEHTTTRKIFKYSQRLILLLGTYTGEKEHNGNI